MILIDGEYGSGGGQILRTAVGLSALTGKDCRIENIRAKRSTPGLREQHLQSLLSVANLCNGNVIGAEIGSNQIKFTPKQVVSKKTVVKISTAGSVGLALQALLIPATCCDTEIEIEGGATYGKWAAPVSYIQNVLCPILRRIGYEADISILREGFYPKGGARVKVRVKKADFKYCNITEKGIMKEVCGISTASSALKNRRVAERQADSASNMLRTQYGIKPNIEIKYSDSVCPGSGILLWIEFENSIIGGSSLGELKKRAEDVGSEAASNLVWEHQNGVIDSHLADQLLPYIAFKGGRISVSKITSHAKTNAYIIEKFLPVKFNFQSNIIEALRI